MGRKYIQIKYNIIKIVTKFSKEQKNISKIVYLKYKGLFNTKFKSKSSNEGRSQKIILNNFS